jgi:ATP:corrinoid adenosyltransferase
MEDNLIAEEESPAAAEVVDLQSPTTLVEDPATETKGLVQVELIQPKDMLTWANKEATGVEGEEAVGAKEELPTAKEELLMADHKLSVADEELLTVDKELLAIVEELLATKHPRPEVEDPRLAANNYSWAAN